MAIHEIRVTSADGEDPVGREVMEEARRSLGVELEHVSTAKVYRLEGISEEEARQVAKGLLTDPVTEQSTIDSPIGFDTRVVEVAYKPGVMNPEAASIIKAAQDLGINPAAATSSTEYAFFGPVEQADVDNVVGRLLVNKTVHEVITETPVTLITEGSVGPVNVVPIREAADEQLDELSKDKLFLSTEEMRVVKDYFKKLDRDPTDAELEIIAARWSEHCGHKTFNAKVVVDGVEKEPLFKRIQDAAIANFKGLVVSAFEDNSGVIKFYDGQAICGKVETHNSPSAVEPYGGAMTGSGGVFRDIMGTGQGAKTIVSTDMFCFGEPDLDEAMLPPGTLHPDYLQRRVVHGVRDYGNRMGIPTANGSVHYHKDFRAKPSVIVGAYGILPENRAEKGRPQVGDLVVIIGGKTGRDGIHGATFSSGEMTERTASVNSSAVQIGNAIEEKRMFDALLEARDQGLIRALTDCGAAGFSSAIGEIGEDVGVRVDISMAPLKYPGLAPWEIWLSESQERMVAAVSVESFLDFLEICQKYNVEAQMLGEFDGSNKLTVLYDEQVVAELDYEFLKNGLPQRVMEAHWEKPKVPEVIPVAPASEQEWIERFKKVLAHGNVCSKEPIVRQYDHGVQGGNIVAPYGGATQEGPNDALVVRPILGKPYGMVQSHGMNPILMRLDPYEGTKWAIAEAAANYVAAGGNLEEAAAVGNYIWPFPDKEEMGSLDLSVDAAVEMMHALKLPVISGKDSLSSTYRGNGEVIKIPPVYAMSVFGRIPDVEKTMTSDIKKPGDSSLYLVGWPGDGLGGSTYYDIAGGSSDKIPKVDPARLRVVFARIQRAIEEGDILACHDISEGGLITAVAEMCFGSGTGAMINIPEHEDPESFLFSETSGCFVVEATGPMTAHLAFDGIPYRLIGATSSETNFEVRRGSWNNLFQADIEEYKSVWQAPMKGIFHE